MKLIEKINQFRRDFTGKYECENCGDIIIQRSCYDDDNFHNNVTPFWQCKKCNKSSNDLGIKNIVTTKYALGEVK